MKIFPNAESYTLIKSGNGVVVVVEVDAIDG
jgi:hypothetical protein